MDTKRKLVNKYRFQLLQMWLTKRYKPGSAIDVGGGKGLLSYLLNKHGWRVDVVDPNITDELTKYKDLETKRRVLIENENFNRIVLPFKEEMAEDYDLLIGLHAHGSNMQIIKAARKYGKDFLLVPCCVIGEPIEKRASINWLGSLFEYSKSLGFEVKKDTLNFKGQNTLIYTDKYLKRN